jgi:hypothetical protein
MTFRRMKPTGLIVLSRENHVNVGGNNNFGIMFTQEIIEFGSGFPDGVLSSHGQKVIVNVAR